MSSSTVATATTLGQSAPLGATVRAGGVNFSLFSRHASTVELLLFDREDDSRPARVIPIDAITNRSYHYWQLPATEAEKGWRRWLDTGLDSPDDIVPWEKSPAVSGNAYHIQPHSVAILFAEEKQSTVSNNGESMRSH